MDTSETGLEKIIVDWLVKENGYEQETPHTYILRENISRP